MSDAIRAEFEVPHGCKPTACCDKKLTRYVLRNSLLTPAKEGVFLAATDGVVASVVKMQGNTDAAYYVPGSLVGTGKKKTRLNQPGTKAVLNGKWECD